MESPEFTNREVKRDKSIHRADPAGYEELKKTENRYNSEVPVVNLLPKVKQQAEAGLLESDDGSKIEKPKNMETPKKIVTVPELPLKTIDILSQALGRPQPIGSPPLEFRTAVEKKTVNKLLSGRGPHRKIRRDVNRMYRHWKEGDPRNAEEPNGPDLEKDPFADDH